MQEFIENQSGNLPTRLLRGFFYLLYHPFAVFYDLVAAVVSAGRWVIWVHQVAPFVAGERILELGHGTGHLQVTLSEREVNIFGIDRSRQMGRIAHRRLSRNQTLSRLACASALALPFPAGAFDTVVATFPSEYIVHPHTLDEIRRVLAPKGRLVVLLSAWITGRSLLDRALAALFKITGQSQPASAVCNRSINILRQAGFAARCQWIDAHSSRLLIVIAEAIS